MFELFSHTAVARRSMPWPRAHAYACPRLSTACLSSPAPCLGNPFGRALVLTRPLCDARLPPLLLLLRQRAPCRRSTCSWQEPSPVSSKVRAYAWMPKGCFVADGNSHHSCWCSGRDVSIRMDALVAWCWAAIATEAMLGLKGHQSSLDG